MTADIRTGHCLCGAVRVTAEIVAPGIQACHCIQCQRWTGGGPLFVVKVRNAVFHTDLEIPHYHHSHWGERAFCPACGSTLYWKMQDGAIEDIAVGLLDDQSGLAVTEEIFTDRRPGWMPPWSRAAQSSEAAETAKLAAYLKETRNDQV